MAAKLHLRLLKWHTDTHEVLPVDADSGCLGVGAADRPSPDQEADDPSQGVDNGVKARRSRGVRVLCQVACVWMMFLVASERVPGL